MLITAANSAPPARAAAPEVAVSEAEPRRATDSAPRATDGAPRATDGAPRSDTGPAAPPQAASQYRLVYDKELSRTFVQVVDRESGEEILRFPPEELVRFINNTIERNGAGGNAGLLVDRSV